MKCLSLTDPVSGSLVSWRAMMSICSLLSSLSMTAVLRASFTSCRSSEKPGVIVLMFIFLLPGAQLSIRLSVFTLHPTHTVRLRDQHLTGWGLLSLRRAVAAYWDAMTSPTAWSSPWRLTLRQLSCRLISGRLLYPVFCRRCKAKLEWPLQVTPERIAMVRKSMESKLLLMQQTPPPPSPSSPSTSLEWSIEKASADTHGSSAITGVSRTLLYTASDCLRDSGSGFFLRVNSRSLSYEWVWLQGSGGFKSSFSFS